MEIFILTHWDLSNKQFWFAYISLFFLESFLFPRQVIHFMELYKCFPIDLNSTIAYHLFTSKLVLFFSLFSHVVCNHIYNWCHFFQDCAIKLSFSLQFSSFEFSSLSGVFHVFFKKLGRAVWRQLAKCHFEQQFFCSLDFETKQFLLLRLACFNVKTLESQLSFKHSHGSLGDVPPAMGLTSLTKVLAAILDRRRSRTQLRNEKARPHHHRETCS